MQSLGMKVQQEPQPKIQDQGRSRPEVQVVATAKPLVAVADSMRSMLRPEVANLQSQRQVDSKKTVVLDVPTPATDAAIRRSGEAGREAALQRLDHALEVTGGLGAARDVARDLSGGPTGLPGLVARLEKRGGDPQVMRETAALAEYMLRSKLPDACFEGPERNVNQKSLHAFLSSALRTMERAVQPRALTNWMQVRQDQAERQKLGLTLQKLVGEAEEGRGPGGVVHRAFQEGSEAHIERLGHALGNPELARMQVDADHVFEKAQCQVAHQALAESMGLGSPGARLPSMSDLAFHGLAQQDPKAQAYFSAACEAHQGVPGAAGKALEAWKALQGQEGQDGLLAQAFLDRNLDPTSLRLSYRAKIEQIIQEEAASPSGPVVQDYLRAARAFREGKPGVTQGDVADAWMKVNLEKPAGADLLKQRGLDPDGLRLIGQTTHPAHDPLVVARAETLVRNIPPITTHELFTDKGWCLAGGPFKVPGAEQADWAVFRRADHDASMIRMGIPDSVTGEFRDVFKGPIEGLKGVDARAYRAALYAAKVDPFVSPAANPQEVLRREFERQAPKGGSFVGGLATVHIQQEANAQPELAFGGFRMIGGTANVPPVQRFGSGPVDARWSTPDRESDLFDLEVAI